MPLEPGIVTFVRQIVRKVKINHRLLQISEVVDIDDIGVLFAVLFCIRLCKLTLTNTGNAMQKNLAVIYHQRMELFHLLFPPKEPPARPGNVGIENIVHHCWGQIARCQKLLLPYITLLETKLHSKA